MVLDGQTDLGRLFVAKFDRDYQFNVDWKDQDAIDEATQQKLLRELIEAINDVQIRNAAIERKQESLGDSVQVNYTRFEEIEKSLERLNTQISMHQGEHNVYNALLPSE